MTRSRSHLLPVARVLSIRRLSRLDADASLCPGQKGQPPDKRVWAFVRGQKVERVVVSRCASAFVLLSFRPRPVHRGVLIPPLSPSVLISIPPPDSVSTREREGAGDRRTKRTEGSHPNRRLSCIAAITAASSTLTRRPTRQTRSSSRTTASGAGASAAACRRSAASASRWRASRSWRTNAGAVASRCAQARSESLAALRKILIRTVLIRPVLMPDRPGPTWQSGQSTAGGIAKPYGRVCLRLAD